MTHEQLKTREDSWKYRRLMAFGSCGSIIMMLGYLCVYGQAENAVQSMMAQSLPLGLIGVIITYIGGPIADDWLQLRMNKS